jgi:thiol-disulfide isomerase/thioredoxin
MRRHATAPPRRCHGAGAGRIRLLAGLLAFGLLTQTGCSSLNPKNWFGNRNTGGAARGDRLPPADTSGALASRGGPARGSGILAGRVVDAFNQMQPGATIDVTPADAGAKPQQIAADTQGYFLVKGLEPGKRYKLTARSRTGNAGLTGTTVATVPNAVVLIKLNEDLGAADAGADGGGAKTGAQGRQQYLHEPDRGSYGGDRLAPQLTNPPPANDGPRLGAPARPPNTPPVQVRPEYTTENDRGLARIPPRAEIKGPPVYHTPPDAGPEREPDRASPPSSAPGSGELALVDFAGQPVPLTRFRGKLVLLDFWSTSCPPCIQALPFLARVHRRYGPLGLEVVGVAHETGTPAEQAQRVTFVATRQSADFPQLLTNGDQCPVLRTFDVQRLPTLVLIDANGQILWRGEGLSVENKARLEEEIRKRVRE